MSHTLQQKHPIEWTEWVKKIKWFMQSQQPLMLVIGKRLNDRTALIEKITKQLRTTNPIICINGSPTTTPQSIKKVLYKYWSKVAINENDTTEKQLRTILDNLKSKRQHILIIRHTEKLSLETLTTIANFANQQNTSSIKLHVLLSGEPSLEDHTRKLTGGGTPKIILDITRSDGLWRQYGIRATAVAGLLLTVFYMNWHFHHQRNTNGKSLNDTAVFAMDAPPLPKYAAATKPINRTPTKPTLASKKESAPTHIPVPTQQLVNKQAKTRPFYTLQLMSTGSKAALQHYASAHNLRQKAHVYPSHYKGQQWYLLGYGHYSNVGAAHQALSHLPKDIKTLKPWIRSIN